MNPLGLVTSVPADVVSALRVLPQLLAQLQRVTEYTAVLPRIQQSIQDVAKDTEALPALHADMRAVAASTGILEGMDKRLATMEAAMPVLVEVQQHLAQLPETINGLSALIERMLDSLDKLDEDVGRLDAAVTPLGKLAGRVPGARK